MSMQETIGVIEIPSDERIFFVDLGVK